MPATHARPSATRHANHAQSRGHYGRLLVMTLLSFAAMYALMYAMVDRFDSVFHNINQVYMAGLMAAAMVLIELAVMGAMYRNRRLNAAIVALAIVALVGCWALIRAQGGVGDRQFLRSMIPHHAGAITMCERAAIRDPAIGRLCGQIIASQRAEIAEMKAMLAESQ